MWARGSGLEDPGDGALDMGKKRLVVEFKKCEPRKCNPEAGVCRACAACNKKLLIQESADEAPMLVSERMCVGCGDCVHVCPCGALRVGVDG